MENKMETFVLEDLLVIPSSNVKNNNVASLEDLKAVKSKASASTADLSFNKASGKFNLSSSFLKGQAENGGWTTAKSGDSTLLIYTDGTAAVPAALAPKFLKGAKPSKNFYSAYTALLVRELVTGEVTEFSLQPVEVTGVTDAGGKVFKIVAKGTATPQPAIAPALDGATAPVQEAPVEPVTPAAEMPQPMYPQPSEAVAQPQVADPTIPTQPQQLVADSLNNYL